MYKSQIRPSLEYCSHVWDSAPKSTVFLTKSSPKRLQPLSHRRLVGDISIFYRYFHRYCSQEIRDIIPVPLRRVRTTRSSTHSHSFQVSLPNPRTLSHNHHSSQERAIYGTSCLLLFMNPTTCLLRNHSQYPLSCLILPS